MFSIKAKRGKNHPCTIATYIFTNGVQYRVLIMLYSDSFIMLYINLTNRHAMQSLSSVTRVHNTEAYSQEIK